MPTFSLPLSNHQTGIVTVPSRAVPLGLEGILILIARNTTATNNIWTSTSEIIVFRIDASFDNEATWTPDMFVGRYSGGLKLDKQGAEITHTEASFFFTPQPTHLRATMEIIGGPIRTSMTFTTL